MEGVLQCDLKTHVFESNDVISKGLREYYNVRDTCILICSTRLATSTISMILEKMDKRRAEK